MSESVSIPRVKIRIESLSDLIFGLALSIGSLILVGKALPTSGQDLLNNVLNFGFSFLIITMTWLGYSRTISVLPIETQSALFLNLGLLFCVALEPYLYYVLFASTIPEAGSMAYGLDVGALFLILASLAYLLLKEENKLAQSNQGRIHPVVISRFKRAMIAQSIIGGLFLASALPIFWMPTPIGYLRFDLWYSAFAFFFLWIPTKKKIKK